MVGSYYVCVPAITNHQCLIATGIGVFQCKVENAFIGPGCGFYTACHPLDHSKRNKGIEWAKPITVGNNVWLGGDVTVLPGVTIGDNSVIGAGSVVTKDIPANCVAVGNPCRVLRKITDDDREYYYKDRKFDVEDY